MLPYGTGVCCYAFIHFFLSIFIIVYLFIYLFLSDINESNGMVDDTIPYVVF